MAKKMTKAAAKAPRAKAAPAMMNDNDADDMAIAPVGMKKGGKVKKRK